MNIKKTILYSIITGLVTFSMSSTYEAATINHINKVLTVMADEKLEEGEAPLLAIKLIDELEEGSIFYLDLTGAKWLETAFAASLSESASAVSLEIKRLSGTRLQVKVKGGSLHEGITIKIPMLLQMTEGSAEVHVKGNNTVVSSGTYLVAETASYKGVVTAGELPKATTGAVMADISIEEPFSKAFHKAIEKEGADRNIQLQLQHNGYAFRLEESQAKLIGSQGFEGVDGSEGCIKQLDEQTLEITLPDISECQYTGCFTLSGVLIQSVDKKPQLGMVQLMAVGDLIEPAQMNVLCVMDYAISLEGTEKKVRAGSKQELCFTLDEKIEDSLVRSRPTSFYLSEGATLEVDQRGKVPVLINNKMVLCESILDDRGKVIGFTVSKLEEQAKSYTFKASAAIDTSAVGSITLTAQGRSLLEELQLSIWQVYPPFMLDVAGFNTVVGLKDQAGGSVTIKETAAGELIQGEKIVLRLEDCAIKYGRCPKVEVLSGDVRLGTPVMKGSTIEIPIVRRSNTASTICISDFNVCVDQTVAVGGYQMTMGGGAFTELLSEGENVPLWQDIFIWVNEKSTENVSTVPSREKITVIFTLGSKNYDVGSVKKVMEAAPYINNGRTMLPVRYVTEALGISSDKLIWNSQKKTVTIYAEDTVILSLGSRQMLINGQSVQMSATPEIKSNRVFIPVAEITRALQITTYWDSVKKQVSFETEQL